MEVLTAIETFVAHRRQANCAKGTLSLYRRQLDCWHAWLCAEKEIGDLTIDDLRDFMAQLRDRRPVLAENTLASYHRTLRAFWIFLSREDGVLTAEQQRFFTRIAAPAVPEDPRPVTDEKQVRRLMAACGDGSNEESARNRAILLLLAETGMRISELCNLTDEVVDVRGRRARVLRTKGKKHRMAFWQQGGAAALARYLLLRRGKHGGPLFRGCSLRNNGGAVTTDLVRSTIKRIARDAGIRLPKGAPLHSIRHGFAHQAIENGAQLTDVADLLGHADLETTRIYLRNDDDRLERTYDRIFGRKSSRDLPHQDRSGHG